MGKLSSSFKLVFVAFFLLLVSGPTLGNNSDDTKVDVESASMNAVMKEVAKEEVTEAYNNYKQEIISQKLGLNLREAVAEAVAELVAKDKTPPLQLGCTEPRQLCTRRTVCCNGGHCIYARKGYPYGACSF
ncbi:hypothetical protein RDABS01_037505 [Bienertia sinuspersici]